ncbi:hypothetical protein ACJJTC_006705 [Scirpophaga incertulas]
MKMDSWGLYTVETKAVVHDDDVETPWEEFVCLLDLSPANYTANRTTVYYPGLMPTAHIAAIEVDKPQERHANANSESKQANMCSPSVQFTNNYLMQKDIVERCFLIILVVVDKHSLFLHIHIIN